MILSRKCSLILHKANLDSHFKRHPDRGPLLSYEAAQRLAWKHGIKTRKHYIRWYKAFPGLRSHPQSIYPQWPGWKIWLRVRLTFKEAQNLLKGSGITGCLDYQKKHQWFPLLPFNPRNFYKDQWTDWNDFLGIPPPLSIEEARKLAIKAGLTRYEDYVKGHHKFPKLPGDPVKFYGISWRTFIGRPAPDILDFKAACLVAKRAKFKDTRDYKTRYHRYPGLPSNPFNYYPQWKDWNHFLGHRARTPKLSYREAQEKVQAAGWTSAEAYKKNYRRIPGLRHCPDTCYPEWTGWFTFLGTQPVSFLSYQDAQRVVKAAGVKSSNDYSLRYRTIGKLPSSPNLYYSEWTGWYDFLGTTVPKKEFLSYSEAQEKVRGAGIRSGSQYKNHYQQMDGLPAKPEERYPEWTGWKPFLGTQPRIVLSIEHSKTLYNHGLSSHFR